MKKLLPILLGLLISQGAWAFGDLIDNSNNAKAAAGALAVAAPVMVLKASPNVTIEGATEAEQNFPVVVASATAHPPSAQCRFGLGAQFGVQEFGIGVSGSEWDRICGLWLAAQQTTGDASNEAATAAYCLTMKDAEVHSETCASWENGQNLAKNRAVALNDERAVVVFGGSGNGGWN